MKMPKNGVFYPFWQSLREKHMVYGQKKKKKQAGFRPRLHPATPKLLVFPIDTVFGVEREICKHNNYLSFCLLNFYKFLTIFQMKKKHLEDSLLAQKAFCEELLGKRMSLSWENAFGILKIEVFCNINR